MNASELCHIFSTCAVSKFHSVNEVAILNYTSFTEKFKVCNIYIKTKEISSLIRQYTLKRAMRSTRILSSFGGDKMAAPTIRWLHASMANQRAASDRGHSTSIEFSGLHYGKTLDVGVVGWGSER